MQPQLAVYDLGGISVIRLHNVEGLFETFLQARPAVAAGYRVNTSARDGRGTSDETWSRRAQQEQVKVREGALRFWGTMGGKSWS